MNRALFHDPSPRSHPVSNRISQRVAQWNRAEEDEGVPSESRSFLTTSGVAPRILLLHGAGGGPHDLHDLADHLATHGHGSLCPLLPAHGRGELALGDLRFDQLLARALECFDLLEGDGVEPVVVAQSFGVVIAIRMAGQRKLGGLVALAPALRPFVTGRVLWLLPLAIVRPRLARATLRWQMEARRAITDARERLADVTCPLLVLHSKDDDSVSIRGARELCEGARSADKRLEVLNGQGHVLSAAPRREDRVFVPVRSFVESL